MGTTKVTKDLATNTLIIERTFNAPQQKLWRAFTDKDWFTKWWGPEGWETTVKEFTVKPGGRNHYMMKCVDKNQGDFFGQESWGLMEYESVDEPNSIRYKDYFADADGRTQADMPATTNTVEFAESDGKTTLITRTQTQTTEELEKLVAMGMIEGYNSSANKLEQLVAE